MISAVNGRKRALLTKSALEWHNKRCTAQSTLCVGNKKGKTELKAMCDFKKKKFSIAILGSRYDTRITGPSIAMHRCIVTLLAFTCLIRKTLAKQGKRNCQSSEEKSFYRSGTRTIDCPVAGRGANPLGHRSPTISPFWLSP